MDAACTVDVAVAVLGEVGHVGVGVGVVRLGLGGACVEAVVGVGGDVAEGEREQHAWSLFGETQARYIVSERFDTDAVEKLARDSGIRCCFIGWTGGETLALCKGETAVYPELALSTLREANEAFFRDWMEA